MSSDILFYSTSQLLRNGKLSHAKLSTNPSLCLLKAQSQTTQQLLAVRRICAGGRPVWAGGPCTHAAVFCLTFLREIKHDTRGISPQSLTGFRLNTLSCHFAKRSCHVLRSAAESSAGSFEWRELGPVSYHAGGVSMRLRGALASTFQCLHFQWHDQPDVSNNDTHLAEISPRRGSLSALSVGLMWGGRESINNVSRREAWVVM